MSLTKTSFSMINGACINVRDFGAIGDGVTDDTAAIQAAINAAIDSTEQRTWAQNYSGSIDPASVAIKVYLPAGEYLVSSTLTAQGALYMEGDGDLASVIVQSSSFTGDHVLAVGFTVGSTAAELFWTWGGRLANFKIVGNGTSKTGVFSWRQHAYSFENVRVSQCAVGIWIEGGYTGLVQNCTVMKNTVGMRASVANSPSPIYEEPNDITFLRCNVYQNTTGYEIDNSTNINIIGGVIQYHTGAGINCTQTVRQLYLDGVYWELNNTASTASAYIIGVIKMLTVNANFINLSAKRFIDTTNITSVSVTNSELFSDGTAVYIPSGAVLQRLEYRNNRPLFSLTINQYIIDNQKTDFVPLPLEIDDFRSAGGIGFSEQLKRAFNGKVGTVVFTQNIDLRWTIDFPCVVTSVSKDVGIKSTPSGSVALTINSSDVTVKDMLVSATGAANAISIGAAATVSDVEVSGCHVNTGSPGTGNIIVSSTSSFVRVLNNKWFRSSAGRSATLNGANCLYSGNSWITNATNVYFDTASSGCKAILTGETLTNVGTGNASL